MGSRLHSSASTGARTEFGVCSCGARTGCASSSPKRLLDLRQPLQGLQSSRKPDSLLRPLEPRSSTYRFGTGGPRHRVPPAAPPSSRVVASGGRLAHRRPCVVCPSVRLRFACRPEAFRTSYSSPRRVRRGTGCGAGGPLDALPCGRPPRSPSSTCREEGARQFYVWLGGHSSTGSRFQPGRSSVTGIIWTASFDAGSGSATSGRTST